MNGSDRRGEIRGRLYMVVGALALFGVVLVAQLARWQLFEGQNLAEAATDESQKRETIDARRGTIYSADGRALATDVYASTLSAAPQEIEDPYELADRLFPLVGMSRDDLASSLHSDSPWVPIADEVPLRVSDEIVSWDEAGVYVEPRLSRSYPDVGLMEPMLGFVNRARDGFYGIEGQYDALLRGQPGARLGEMDVYGQDVPFGATVLEPPVDGSDVYLTIDSRVQYVLWRELRDGLEKYQATSGSIIVLDPRTGAIIGAVYLPSYDPNSYETAETARFEDPMVSQEYEPGSVFKVITMAAGLDAAVVEPDTVYNDTGEFDIAGVTVRNWDRLAHGNVTMTEVLSKSLNTGASFVSTTLGAERFYQYVAAFGFGQTTGIDLQGEVAGTVKAPGDGRWYEADLATNSFGQGLACTPLQMLASIAAIANGGVLMQPYVVGAVSQGGQMQVTEPVAVRQVVSAETALTLTQMLVQVVKDETNGAAVPGFTVAGKTGTAQIPIPGGYDPSGTIASFVGYFPAEAPRLCILVKIDRPQASQWGSQVAAPIFSRVASELVLLLGIEPSPAVMAQDASQ
jgi:cell division protein FtsI (penicillin-binding protein 3)